jgi:hypothetical protein
MKTILKITAVAGLAFTMASCGAVNDPYGNNYPNNYPTNYPNDGTFYRAPDGTVYGRGDVYRDRDGNVYQNGRVVRTGDVYGNTGNFRKKWKQHGLLSKQQREKSSSRTGEKKSNGGKCERLRTWTGEKDSVIITMGK